MQKAIEHLNVDCLEKVFSYLPTSDLLTVEKVSPEWNLAAKLAWRRYKTLNIRGVPTIREIKQIVEKASDHIRTLNLEESRYTDPILKELSGHLPRVERIIFSKLLVVTDQQVLEIITNSKNLEKLTNKDNIINVMRWGAKLRLADVTVEAVNRYLEFENDMIFSEYDFYRLLEELEHSERIFLRTHYPWAFENHELNIKYRRLIKKRIQREIL